MADHDHDLDIVLNLTVEVRPAHRLSRWAWHLIDRRDRSDFEIGFEYESPSEARQAALSRLAELTSAMPGATSGVGSSSFRPPVSSKAGSGWISHAA